MKTKEKRITKTFRMGNIIVLLFIQFTIFGCQQKDSLLFPVDKYTVQTKDIQTSLGKRSVVYKSYLLIPYVANPVYKDYQCLNVFVPVKIDNKNLDVTNAPILFNIGVGGYMSVNNEKAKEMNNRTDLALAAGYVVVSPACRGRDNKDSNGKYYGKAPAAIVDLKAAVRYIRHNKGRIPGNTERIISVGCSAGGALSALLGTSGNSDLYDSYLKEIGAADEKDNIYASACYSPITDLENADMAYEWMYGLLPTKDGKVNQNLSEELKTKYPDYLLSLNLIGKDDFGAITADNYKDYLLKYYLFPSLSDYLNKLSPEKLEIYLKSNPWIMKKNENVTFTFDAYLKHIGRMKGLPAFDDFEKHSPETELFGNDSINSRHFTTFSLRFETKLNNAKIDNDLNSKVNMMNAMYFIINKNQGCANYWWLRNGTSDNHTSQTVMINLATKLQNANKSVNTQLFWDGGHCADNDPEGFIKWIENITGYTMKN